MLFIIGLITTHFWDESTQIQELILIGDYDDTSYLFLITILMESGTTANIGFQICGNEKSSEKIHLNIPQMHAKSSQISFFLATKNHLGEIKSLDMWHDNSGVHPSWKMFWIFVKDLKTNEIYNFDCRCTLTVRHTIHRSFVPLVKPAYTSKVAIQLFHKIKNQHILLSIIKCSPFDICGHSIRFTFAFLFVSLIFCFTAFYIRYFARIPHAKDLKQAMLPDLVVCLLLLLIAWSITVAWYEIFRKSIVKFFRRSKSDLEAKKLVKEYKKLNFPEILLDIHHDHLASCENPVNNVLGFHEGKINYLTEATTLELKNLRPRQTKLFRNSMLAMLVLIFLCLIFIAMFGRNFSSDAFLVWNYLSLGGVLLILIVCETIRVYVLALINAAFRSTSEEYFESLNCQHFLLKLIRQNSKIEPLGGFSLLEAKNRHEKRKHFQHVLLSSALHFLLIFLVGMMVISTSDNAKSIELRRAMEKHFDEVLSENIKALDRIDDIWTWIETTATRISSLKCNEAGNHILLQAVQLRQMRFTPLKCITDRDPCSKSSMQKYCSCNPHWQQDEGSYKERWETLKQDDNKTSPWHFQSAILPHVFSKRGKFGRYGDEGYSALLRNSSDLELLTNLKRNLWIDDRTKVVFIEFVAYSLSTRKFSMFQFSQEMSCTGSVQHLHSLEFLSLFEIQSPMTITTLIPCVSLAPMSILLLISCFSKYGNKSRKVKLVMKIAACWISIISFIIVTIVDSRTYYDYLNDDESFKSFKESHAYQQLMKNFNAIFFWALLVEVINKLQYLSLFNNLSSALNSAVLKCSSIFIFYVIIITITTVIKHFLMIGPATDQYHRSFVNSLVSSFHKTFVLTSIINKLFVGFAFSIVMFSYRIKKQENRSKNLIKQSFTNAFIQELKQIFGGHTPKRPTFQRVQFQESSSSSSSCHEYESDCHGDSAMHSENSSDENISIVPSNFSDPFSAMSISLDVTQYRLNYLTRHDDDDD